jgi:hypothetical protein
LAEVILALLLVLPPSPPPLLPLWRNTRCFSP